MVALEPSAEDSPEGPESVPQTHRRISPGLVFWIGFAYFTFESLLRFAYKYFDELAREKTARMLEPLVEELTGGYTSGALLLFLVLFIARHRLTRATWPRRAPVYLVALVAYSVLKTIGMWASRTVLFPALGMGTYDYGIMAFRFPMEFFNDVGGFLIVVIVVHLVLYYIEGRDRELRAARLESRLNEAKLHSLQTQLQPHFLFNTLNAISSYVYRDAATADRMISRLADMLRITLATPEPWIRLDEELSILGLYVEIMKLRFPDRLKVHLSIAGNASDAAVPPLLLQPLMENAVQHGVAKHSRSGSVEVVARRQGDRLVLRVMDDGPGIAEPMEAAVARGMGLRTTMERLRHLTPDHSLDFANRAEGGLEVRIELPYTSLARGRRAETQPAPGAPAERTAASR